MPQQTLSSNITHECQLWQEEAKHAHDAETFFKINGKLLIYYIWFFNKWNSLVGLRPNVTVIRYSFEEEKKLIYSYENVNDYEGVCIWVFSVKILAYMLNNIHFVALHVFDVHSAFLCHFQSKLFRKVWCCSDAFDWISCLFASLMSAN